MIPNVDEMSTDYKSHSHLIRDIVRGCING